MFGYLEFTEPTPFTDHIKITVLAAALLLKGFPSAKHLSWENLTPSLAVEAFRAVEAIHGALVIHGDVNERNILVVGDGKVVLIDFDASSTWPYCKSVTKNEVQRERCRAWTLIFMELPIIKIVNGSDVRLQRKLWEEYREAWDYCDGGEEPESVGDGD